MGLEYFITILTQIQSKSLAKYSNVSGHSHFANYLAEEFDVLDANYANVSSGFKGRDADGKFACRVTASETAGEVGPFGINLKLIPQRD